jgi:hypothetical protein
MISIENGFAKFNWCFTMGPPQDQGVGEKSRLGQRLN